MPTDADRSPIASRCVRIAGVEHSLRRLALEAAEAGISLNRLGSGKLTQ